MIFPVAAALLLVPQVTQVEAVLEHTLGAPGGSPESIFGRVTDLAADDDGSVYVLDGLADALRVFSAEGEYLRTIGRRGGGEGQFSRPSHVDVRDGVVTVLNPGGRTSSFTLEGDLVESTTLPFGSLSAARLAGDSYAVYVSGGITRETPIATESVILKHPASADTIVTVPSSDLLYVSRAATSLIRTSLCRLAYLLVGSEEELWVASGIDGTLTPWRLGDGSIEREPPTRVAPEGTTLADSTRSRLMGLLPRQLDPASGDLTVPPTSSSVCGLERSGDETIWVRLADVDGRERWLALDASTHTPTRQMTAPEGVAMSAFSGERAYGTWMDESRVSYVGLYRLQ